MPVKCFVSCRQFSHLPWLYYPSLSAERVLTDPNLTAVYTMDQGFLDLNADVYTPNGTFLGFKSVAGGLLHFCKSSRASLDAAYQFGTHFLQEVCLLNMIVNMELPELPE